MGIFNWFGNSEHRVFNYQPRYYDPKEEERRRKFGPVEHNAEKSYEPGSYVRGALRGGRYSKERGHATKAQNIIGIVGLLLVFLVLFYIAKFYSLL